MPIDYSKFDKIGEDPPLPELPEDQKQVLILRELEDMPYKEIADILDIPEGTVMSRLYYARRRLQEVLADLRPS